MSVLQKISFYQGRRDEVPNQEAARELARTRNQDDIREIASHLWDPEPNIRSDCLKVLYELGYLAPELITPYADDFLKLLSDRVNRMVWGGMIALSTVAPLLAEKLFPHVELIQRVMASGTVITNDAGMKTLCAVAAHNDEYRQALLPYLFEQLATIRPIDAPRYAGFILPCITPAYKKEFQSILQERMATTEGARLSRLKKIYRQVGEIS